MSDATIQAGHAAAVAPTPATAQLVVDEPPRIETRAVAATSAVSPEQIEQVAAARRRASKISRAASIAAFSGWTIGFFAIVSLLSGLFSVRALLLGVALCVVAFVELRGSRGLRVLDLAAPRRLALNQVGLAVAVVIYAGWGIGSALLGPGSYDEHIAAGGQFAETLEPLDRLTRVAMVAFYALVIAGSVIAQGCTALYYMCRRRHIAAYLDSTPAWIVETLRAAA